MSGGIFQYQQSTLISISEEIEERVDKQNTLIPEEHLILNKEYYEKNPEEAFYPVYSGEIQQRFREAIYHLKKAYIYAQRIDWFLSGDDGEEAFLERLEKELKELDNKI